MFVFTAFFRFLNHILNLKALDQPEIRSFKMLENARFLEYASVEFVFSSVFVFLKNYFPKILTTTKESQNVNLWSSQPAILVSFRNVWSLLSWFHWSKRGKLSMCRSFSCLNYTISFVKKQIIWKLIFQKLIVKFK